MKLIMYLAFVESIFQVMLVASFNICYLRNAYLFSWTVFFSDSKIDILRATNLLASSSTYFAVMCINLSISLNIMLCIDLVLMVRYPFDNKESRLPVYLAVSVLISAFLTFMTQGMAQ